MFNDADSNKSEKLSSHEFMHNDETFKDFKETNTDGASLNVFDPVTLTKDELIAT